MDSDLQRIAEKVHAILAQGGITVSNNDLELDLETEEYPIISFYDEEYSHVVTLAIQPA